MLKLYSLKDKLVCAIMILAILLYGITVSAQKEIIYDFETKLATIPIGKLNEPTVVRVSNINKLVYGIKITSKEIDFISTAPKGLYDQLNINQIFAGLAGLINQSNQGSDTPGGDPVDSRGRTLDSDGDGIADGSDFEPFFPPREGQAVDSYGVILERSHESSEIIAALRSEIRTLQELINHQNEKIESQKREIERLREILATKILQFKQQIDSAFSVLQIYNNSFDDANLALSIMDQIAGQPSLTHSRAIIQIEKLRDKYQFIDNPTELITLFRKQYAVFENLYNSYLTNPIVNEFYRGNEIDIVESLSPISRTSKALRVKAYSDETYVSLMKLNKIHSILQDSLTYEYISDVMQPEKDIVEFNVVIAPRQGITLDTTIKLESRDFNLKIPTRGGIKVDYSTGLFLLFGLNDRSYSVVENPNSSSLSIIENRENDVAQSSFGVLLHVSPRWKSLAKPGIAVGIGLNTAELSKANIFIGGNIIFGKLQRVVISAGFALSSIDYLSEEYEIGKDYSNDILRTDTDIITSSTRAGLFLGFTYNLNRRE